MDNERSKKGMSAGSLPYSLVCPSSLSSHPIALMGFTKESTRTRTNTFLRMRGENKQANETRKQWKKPALVIATKVQNPRDKARGSGRIFAGNKTFGATNTPGFPFLGVSTLKIPSATSVSRGDETFEYSSMESLKICLILVCPAKPS